MGGKVKCVWSLLSSTWYYVNSCFLLSEQQTALLLDCFWGGGGGDFPDLHISVWHLYLREPDLSGRKEDVW